jgi:hypothetical protein
VRNLLRAFSLLLLAPTIAGCFESPRRPLGDVCEETEQCQAGECLAGVCLDPEGDADDDGLINRVEHALGTNPLEADSDGDGLGDLAEVGDVDAPRDGDLDGKLDAAESSENDADGDCIRDPEDPEDDVAETDAAARGAKLCLRSGVCAEGGATATCESGESSCDYAAVVGFEPEETSCDGLDNDCDGATDERFAEGGAVTLASALNPADDGKVLGAACGVGACSGGAVVCDPSRPDRLTCSTDDAADAPACDADADCDGEPDAGEDLAGCTKFHVDVDGDGYGVDEALCLCAPDDTYRALEAGDCDDASESTRPGSAVAACGVDGDCDGSPQDVAEVCDDADEDPFNGCHQCEAGPLALRVPEEGMTFGGLTGLPAAGWSVLWSTYRQPASGGAGEVHQLVQRFGPDGRPLGGRGWSLGPDASPIAKVATRERVILIASRYDTTSGLLRLTRTDVMNDGSLAGPANAPFAPFGDVALTSFSLRDDPVLLPDGGVITSGFAAWRDRACPDGSCASGFWIQLGPAGDVVTLRRSMPSELDVWSTRYTNSDGTTFHTLSRGHPEYGPDAWTVRAYAGVSSDGRERFVFPCPSNARCDSGDIARHGDDLVVAMNLWSSNDVTSWGWTVVMRFALNGTPVAEPIYPFGPPTAPVPGEPPRYPTSFRLLESGTDVLWLVPTMGSNAAGGPVTSPKRDTGDRFDPGSLVAERLAGDGETGLFVVRGLESAYSVGCVPLLAGQLLCGGAVTSVVPQPDGSQSYVQDSLLWRFGPAEGRVMVLTQPQR